MGAIAPQTDVYLLKCPLEISDINQLTFSNVTAQYNYFNSLPKIGLDNFTYQRKDGTIRYAGNFDELIQYNYVMYRNDAYSNKWFYAFISGMEYLNDNVTAIAIKTDVWQTWQFQLNFKPCLIDREHTNDDTIGANTLPESLELGEPVANGSLVNFGANGKDVYFIVEVSQIENEGENATLSYQWSSGTHNTTPYRGGVPSGVTPLIVGIGTQPLEYRSVEDIIRLYDKAGLGDSIVNVYPIPKSFIPAYYELTLSVQQGDRTDSVITAVPADNFSPITIGTTAFVKPTSIAGYIPKNRKLLTYPFCYFNVSNNAGTSIPYRYEDFNGDCQFYVEGVAGVSGNTKAIPQNYKRISNNDNGLDYGITGAKFPVGSWNNDSYTNWLTQNAVNMQTQWRTTIMSSAGEVIGGGLTAGPAGAILGGIAAVKNLIGLARDQMLAKTSANLVPDQARGNLNVGDLVWAKIGSQFTYIPMCIKPEYAKCVDEYLSEFGYKCNRVKTPNITGRRNWNYVKTIGCYIQADIPQTDLAEIKSMFDNGITLWHNPATFADYSQNNDII